jgi:hypothetical protein
MFEQTGQNKCVSNFIYNIYSEIKKCLLNINSDLECKPYSGDRETLIDSDWNENKRLQSIRENINRLQYKLYSWSSNNYLSIFLNYETMLFPSLEIVTFGKLKMMPSHLWSLIWDGSKGKNFMW